jgi:hypothetical protein
MGSDLLSRALKTGEQNLAMRPVGRPFLVQAVARRQVPLLISALRVVTSLPAGERPATDGRAGMSLDPKRCAKDGGFRAIQSRGIRILNAGDDLHCPTAAG